MLLHIKKKNHHMTEFIKIYEFKSTTYKFFLWSIFLWIILFGWKYYYKKKEKKNQSQCGNF